MSHEGTTIFPPEYYNTIQNLGRQGKMDAAFVMMNMVNVVDLNDITYWQCIPMIVLNLFNNDTDKLHLYGMRLANKKGTKELSLCFARRLIEINQLSKAKEIIIAACCEQFGYKIEMSNLDKDRNVTRDKNYFASAVYKLALRFNSPGLYGTFVRLFEEIETNKRSPELYQCYQHALLSIGIIK